MRQGIRAQDAARMLLRLMVRGMRTPGDRGAAMNDRMMFGPMVQNLIHTCAAKGMNDTGTNPSPQAQHLATAAARAGFRAAIMEVAYAMESLNNNPDIRNKYDYNRGLDEILQKYLDEIGE